MIANVKFYSLPVDYIKMEVPMITSTSNISSYLKYDQDLKCTEDFVQVLTVPYFEGYSLVNTVNIGDDWYKVVSYESGTHTNQAVLFTIEWLAFSSTYHNTNDDIVGIYTRKPSFTNGWQERIMGGGTYEVPGRTIDIGGNYLLPKIDGKQVYFVQIVSTKERTNRLMNSVRRLALDGDNRAKEECLYDDTGDLIRYGMFVSADRTAKLKAGTGRFFVTKDNVVTVGVNLDTNLLYPSLDEVVNHIDEHLKQTASSVVSVTISPRCPFEYVKDNDDTIRLVHGQTAFIPNVSVYGNLIAQQIGQVTTYNLYNVMSYYQLNGKHIGTDIPDNASEQTITVRPSESEKFIGTFNIKDASGNIVAPIEMSCVRYDASGNFSLKTQTVSSNSGIITFIMYNDIVIRYYEASLEFVGDAEQEYKALQRVFDLETMNATIQSNNDDFEYEKMQSIAQSVSNIAFGSVIGGIGGLGGGGIKSGLIGLTRSQGGNVAGQIASTLLTVDALKHERDSLNDLERQKQEIRDRSAKRQNGIPYMSGNSYTFLFENEKAGLRLAIDMPMGMSHQSGNWYYQAYTAQYGYPCEVYESNKANEGVWAVRLTVIPIKGIKGDRLYDEMQQVHKVVKL